MDAQSVRMFSEINVFLAETVSKWKKALRQLETEVSLVNKNVDVEQAFETSFHGLSFFKDIETVHILFYLYFICILFVFYL